MVFDCAGAVGQREPGSDGGQVPLAKPRRSLTGLFSALAAQVFRYSPWRWQKMSAKSRTRARATASSVRPSVIVASVARVGVGELAGRVRIPGGDLLGRGCWRWPWGGGVAAELGGEAAQGAGAQLLVQLLGAAHSLVPSLVQVGLVRADQAWPGQPGGG